MFVFRVSLWPDHKHDVATSIFGELRVTFKPWVLLILTDMMQMHGFYLLLANRTLAKVMDCFLFLSSFFCFLLIGHNLFNFLYTKVYRKGPVMLELSLFSKFLNLYRKFPDLRSFYLLRMLLDLRFVHIFLEWKLF